MKVKCIANKIVDLPREFIEEMDSSLKDIVFQITPGKVYTVYALSSWNNIVLYFICDDNFTTVPTIIPAPFFEIIDHRMSRYWIFNSSHHTNSINYFINEWAFPEWALDQFFYRRLSEWEIREEKIFAQYKVKMDLEFPDPRITETAGIGDRDWLMCPTCIDAWQWPSDLDAQVICPKCGTVYKNPRYNAK